MKRHLLLFAVALTTAAGSFAGVGTKTDPFTVSELDSHKAELLESGDTVWVVADLKGFGEDGTLTANDSYEDENGKKQYRLAALFGDATGSFVGYSYQILGELSLDDLTNTKELLIALNYRSKGHPYGNTSYPDYATDYEPQTPHFSLVEVRGGISLNISGGYRGWHVPASYIVPEGVVAVKVNGTYNTTSGARVTYTYFDGADAGGHVTPKNIPLVLMAGDGTYDVVLTSALYEQSISNGNGMHAGNNAGVNVVTTPDRLLFRFVSEDGHLGFERNGDNAQEVVLARKDEVFLVVSSRDNNFGGNWQWETDDHRWISWGGKAYSDFHDPAGIGELTLGRGLDGSQAVYDLSGRRLPSVPRNGIWLQGGKKYVAK